MKTIVLIGKQSEQLRATYDFLRQYFRVQLCTEGVQQAVGTVKVVSPELIVIALAGLGNMDRGLFVELQNQAHDVPVLTYGTETEMMPFGSFYWVDQFENLTAPVAQPALLAAVCARLGISEAEVKDEAAAAQDDGRRKVLVVDDNAATLRSIKGMLERKYNVTLANSGMKALASIGKSRPDLILLDYEMPVCDGRQTLEMIRAEEEIADIPVIFLTSVNDKEHIEAVIKLRPAGYLLKPPIPGKLTEAIDKALGDA